MLEALKERDIHIQPLLNQRDQHNENINAYYDSPAVELFEDFAQKQIHLGYWDDRYPNVSLNQAAMRLTQVVLDYIRVPKDGIFLDIGCGCGLPAMEIAKQKQCLVRGITINPQQKYKADKLCQHPDMQDKLFFTLGDATHLPYPTSMFDGALLLESIHHIGHGAALREAHRVLKNEGEVIVADGVVIKSKAPQADINKLAEIFVAKNLSTSTALRATMEQTGFKVTESIDLTQAVLPTWSRLLKETQNNQAAIVAKHGIDFFNDLMAFWEEIRILWTNSARYMLFKGIKQ